MHPAIGAAWIHAFSDGNGRTARVCASLAMYRGGFTFPEFTSLEEWWGRHLEDGYAWFRALGSRFDPEVDATDVLVAHVRAQLHQVRALDLRERVQRQVWLALDRGVLGADLEPRVTNAACDAFFGRDVTPRYYRPLADIGAATATNDLAAAVAAKLLRPEGRGRSRRYVAGADLHPSVARALGLGEPGRLAPEEGRARILGELTKRATRERPPVPISDR